MELLLSCPIDAVRCVGHRSALHRHMHRTDLDTWLRCLVLRSGTLEEIHPARLLLSGGSQTVWSLLLFVAYRGKVGEGVFCRLWLIGERFGTEPSSVMNLLIRDEVGCA